MKCQMCGEMNTLDVRFCEHCGARLAQPVIDSSAMTGKQQVVDALTCSQCGAIVLPGEAYCDNCGVAVASPANQISSSMQVVDLPSGGFAETPQDMNNFHQQEQTSVSGGVEYRIDDAPEEPHTSVTAEETTEESHVVEDTAVVAEVEQPVLDDVATSAVEAVIEPEAGDMEEQPVVEHAEPVEAAAPAFTMPTAEPESPVVVDSDDTENDVPAETVAEVIDTQESAESTVEYTLSDDEQTEAAALSPSDIQALKQRRQDLEAQIKRQKDIIQQLDQMRRAFREVTPQAVIMGITEAEHILQQAESELSQLPIPPEIDPAVIERLKKDLARQIEIIEQFEQLQKTFGSATPRAVLQGIVDARETEAAIRSELQALGIENLPPKVSGTEPAPPPVVTPPPVESPSAQAKPVVEVAAAPVVNQLTPAAVPAVQPQQSVVMPAPKEEALAVAADPATAIEKPVSPVANPVMPAARLQLESGTVLPLPTGRREIIIGRDDPISGVHPEIDLTPYGAESGGVSRRHVRLTVIDGQWMITDLQSTNHTRVNGVRIDPGVPTQLPDGAQVVLGRIGFVFRSM